MSEQAKCPMCGALAIERMWQGQPVYRCGTIHEGGKLKRGDQCKDNQIAALRADNERLLAIATKTAELLDLIYPTESFDGTSGDRGAVLVAELRGLIDARKDVTT